MLSFVLVLSFLQGDVSKAIDAIKTTLQWRKEFEVDKIIHAFDNTKKKDTNNADDDEERRRRYGSDSIERK